MQSTPDEPAQVVVRQNRLDDPEATAGATRYFITSTPLPLLRTRYVKQHVYLRFHSSLFLHFLHQSYAFPAASRSSTRQSPTLKFGTLAKLRGARDTDGEPSTVSDRLSKLLLVNRACRERSCNLTAPAFFCNEASGTRCFLFMQGCLFPTVAQRLHAQSVLRG